jgi:hypothetical protein
MPQGGIVESQEIYERASKRVAAKISFFVHLTVYVVVNLLLLTIDLVTSPGQLWFYWPLLGWGIGLCFHGLSVFFFGRLDSLKERMIEKELTRTSPRTGGKGPG